MKYILTKKAFLNEAGLGYPTHILETPSIAGIEEEDFDPIVILEDVNGNIYAISEDFLDFFLNDNPSFKITSVKPEQIVVIDEYETTKEFDMNKNTIKWKDGEWKYPNPSDKLFVVN